MQDDGGLVSAGTFVGSSSLCPSSRVASYLQRAGSLLPKKISRRGCAAPECIVITVFKSWFGGNNPIYRAMATLYVSSLTPRGPLSAEKPRTLTESKHFGKLRLIKRQKKKGLSPLRTWTFFKKKKWLSMCQRNVVLLCLSFFFSSSLFCLSSFF